MTTLFPTALLQSTLWLFKPLFVWFVKKCIQCHLLILTAVTHVWHLRAFISWQTWSWSRRQRRLQRIRFIVEKERSTVAVPTGSRSSLRTAVENAGNMATLSAESARFSILPVVSRSPGRRLRIFHSDCKSVADTDRMRATVEKSAGCCMLHKITCT